MTSVYPGTFDPITYGHLDVIRRACRLFDRVVVGVARRREKSTLFSFEERIELTRSATRGMEKVEVFGFEGLLVDFAAAKGAQAIVRGLRAVADFDYELQMALTNRKFAPEIEIVYFMPGENFFYISSSLVKELAAVGGEIAQFVPEPVAQALSRKYSR